LVGENVQKLGRRGASHIDDADGQVGARIARAAQPDVFLRDDVGSAVGLGEDVAFICLRASDTT